MNHGTERNRKRYESLTPQQKAAVDAIRAENSTPAKRDEDERVREAVRKEFPPVLPEVVGVEAAETFASFRRARESMGLSLSDVQERTGIDRGNVSKLERGEFANPTLRTLQVYAAALDKRMVFELVDDCDYPSEADLEGLTNDQVAFIEETSKKLSEALLAELETAPTKESVEAVQKFSRALFRKFRDRGTPSLSSDPSTQDADPR